MVSRIPSCIRRIWSLTIACDTSSDRCRMPVGPRDRLGGGSVVPYQHAQQGGQGTPVVCVAEDTPLTVCVASRKPILMCECLIQHGMEEVNPRIGIRLRHPKELTLHCLHRIRLYICQHEELFVGDRRSRTKIIGPVTTARTGLPIEGAVLPIGCQRVLDMRQQRGTF